MTISRQHLHTLVDMVDESGLVTLYNVMIRFIPEDDAAPDEVEAIVQARGEYERGETVKLADLELGEHDPQPQEKKSMKERFTAARAESEQRDAKEFGNSIHPDQKAKRPQR